MGQVLYSDEHDEQSITEILNGSGIPVHQLYTSIEMAKNWILFVCHNWTEFTCHLQYQEK